MPTIKPLETQEAIKRAMHPRLARLNRELMDEKTLYFDYVTVTHSGASYRVHIARTQDNRYFASCKAIERVFRCTEPTPARAVAMLVRQLRWGIDRWIVNQNFRRANTRHVARTA